MQIEPVGHLCQRLVPEIAVARPQRRLERPLGSGDRGSCFGFAPVVPLAQHLSRGRVDRLINDV